jgi:hypothetical protein
LNDQTEPDRCERFETDENEGFEETERFEGLDFHFLKNSAEPEGKERLSLSEEFHRWN